VVVFWSIPARDDLKGIHDYIARDSNHYAKRVTQDIREKAKLLRDSPQLGKMVPALTLDSLTTILELSVSLVPIN
jgi:toxin ParE1/3/4